MNNSWMESEIKSCLDDLERWLQGWLQVFKTMC